MVPAFKPVAIHQVLFSLQELPIYTTIKFLFNRLATSNKPFASEGVSQPLYV